MELKDTAQLMLSEDYKETSLGGLAKVYKD